MWPVVMGTLQSLGGALAFLDAVAEKEGIDGAGVSETLRAEASKAVSDSLPWASAAAAAAVGWYLESKLNGVRLDAKEPFSDSSLAGALSQVLGVTVASVKDREALRVGLWSASTKMLSEQTGVPFRDLRDRKTLREDVLRAIGAMATQLIPGLEIADLSNRSQTIADIDLYCTRVVSSATGINFTNLHSAQAVKEDIYAWALPQIQAETGEAPTDYKRVLKMDRKSVRNREAQRRFRAKWGRREEYRKLEEGE